MDESSPPSRGESCQPQHADFNPDIFTNAAAQQANYIHGMRSELQEQQSQLRAQENHIDELMVNAATHSEDIGNLKDELQRVKKRLESQLQPKPDSEPKNLDEARVFGYFLRTVVKLSGSDIDMLQTNGIVSFDHLQCLSLEKLKTLNLDIQAVGNLLPHIDRARVRIGTIVKCTQELQQQQQQQQQHHSNAVSSSFDFGEILRPNYDCISCSLTGNAYKTRYASLLFGMTEAGRRDLSRIDTVKCEIDDFAVIGCSDSNVARRIKKLDTIRAFLMKNGVDNVDPSIHVGQNVNNADTHSTRKKSSQVFVALQSVLLVSECKSPHTTELTGKQTVYAAQDIPEWTVLGEYCGVDMLEKEYEDVWQNKVQKSENEKYILKKSITVSVPFSLLQEIYCGDGDQAECARAPRIDDNPNRNHNHNHNRCASPVFSPTQRKRRISDVCPSVIDDGEAQASKKRRLNVRNYDDFESKHHDKQFAIVTDALRLQQLQKIDCPIWQINDCRECIFMDKPSTQDEARRNVRSVKCLVDEWPRYFIINDKAIKCGEELLGYYGPTYEDNIYAQRRDHKLKTKLSTV